MNDTSGIVWPKPFVTGEISYADDHEGRRHALADASSAWGCCSGGASSLPDKFGTAMAKISAFLGINGTPEGVSGAVEAWIREDYE